MASSDAVVMTDCPTAELRCWHTNANSLNTKKLKELRLIIHQSELDIIFITETKWDEKTTAKINGYEHFSKACDKNGGGVCIYVRDNKKISGWKMEPMACVCLFEDAKHECKHKDVEQIWCLLTIKEDYKILLGCIYRPGNLTPAIIQQITDEKINKIIEKTGDLVKDKKINGIILAGDFNYPEIVWKKMYDKVIEPTTSTEREFVKAINKSGLHQNINFKTSIETLNNDSLDLVFTDTAVEAEQDKFLGDSFLNNHIGIFWKYKVQYTFERENDAEFLDYYKPWLNRRYEKFNKFAKMYNQFCKHTEGVLQDFKLQHGSKFKPEKISEKWYWFDDRLYCLQEKQSGQPTYECRFKGCTASFSLQNGNDIDENTHKRAHKDGCEKRKDQEKGLKNKDCTYFELKSIVHKLNLFNCYFLLNRSPFNSDKKGRKWKRIPCFKRREL